MVISDSARRCESAPTFLPDIGAPFSVSQTKMLVGIIASPGWLNTMLGLRRSPNTSQTLNTGPSIGWGLQPEEWVPLTRIRANLRPRVSLPAARGGDVAYEMGGL